MISINKHYHKGEYDKVDKILDKLDTGFSEPLNRIVNGCTDSTATNYDATATTDDGSCLAINNIFTTLTANHKLTDCDW